MKRDLWQRAEELFHAALKGRSLPAGLTPSDSFPKTCDIFISIVENPKIKRAQLTYCYLSDAPENPDMKIPFLKKGFYSTCRLGHCRTNAEIDSRLGPGDSGRTGPVEPENKETIKSNIQERGL